MQKKALSLLLALAMVFSLAACAQTPPPSPAQTPPRPLPAPPPQRGPSAEPSVEPTAAGTRSFTDSCGRTVEFPPTSAASPPPAPWPQIVLFALAPDKFVGIASKWSKETESFIDGSYYNLPVLGQLYGSSAGELNLETLAAADPQVIIDIGEPKEDHRGGHGRHERTARHPAVPHRRLHRHHGRHLPPAGANCWAWRRRPPCWPTTATKRYSGTLSPSWKGWAATRANVLYCLGDQGLNVIAKDSFHGEVLDLMTNNLAVVGRPSSKGTSNESDINS